MLIIGVDASCRTQLLIVAGLRGMSAAQAGSPHLDLTTNYEAHSIYRRLLAYYFNLGLCLH